MEQNKNSFAPEAATDEPASSLDPIAEDEDPAFASEAERGAYWQGVVTGIRDAGREPGHPHMPADFALDLTRDGAGPGLTSTKLLEAWPHDPHDSNPALLCDPRTRHDGWGPAKERIFLATLADTGVVADACRACKMSRNSAYERRRSASGRAFALGWDAAILIARGAVTDDVLSRSRHGIIDRVYRNGELVAERHRYDNRLTMAVLSRLDRLAEGLGEGAHIARAVAQEFDRFLDLLPDGVRGAETFLAARFPTRSADAAPDAIGEQTLLARLNAYAKHGVGLPQEIDLDGLDPSEMASWTEAQWERAEFSGLLQSLTPVEWPEAARDASQDDTNGMCHLRHLYLRYHPAPPLPAEDEEDDMEDRVWQQMSGEWQTDFPPPEGFDGWEEGEPGEQNYRRELTEEEREVLDLDEAGEEAERAELLAADCAARDRYFGFETGAEMDKEE